MGYPSLPSRNEIENLADNWCHDNLLGKHWVSEDAVYKNAVAAYLAGYEQARQDVKDALS